MKQLLIISVCVVFCSCKKGALPLHTPYAGFLKCKQIVKPIVRKGTSHYTPLKSLGKSLC
jgi:hypothetical protein